MAQLVPPQPTGLGPAHLPFIFFLKQVGVALRARGDDAVATEALLGPPLPPPLATQRPETPRNLSPSQRTESPSLSRDFCADRRPRRCWECALEANKICFIKHIPLVHNTFYTVL